MMDFFFSIAIIWFSMNFTDSQWNFEWISTDKMVVQLNDETKSGKCEAVMELDDCFTCIAKNRGTL